ncbi:hypothetical protein EDB85DRAFT_1838685, partial [Lactarius pseudohatsudake]
CVVASRLAAADENLHIFLVEAGPTTYNDPAHTGPLRLLSHLAPNSRTVRAHISRPSAVPGSCSTSVPCGPTVRLPCAPSFVTIVVRQSASDYDDRETVYQNPWWGSKNIIPFLRK